MQLFIELNDIIRVLASLDRLQSYSLVEEIHCFLSNIQLLYLIFSGHFFNYIAFNQI